MTANGRFWAWLGGSHLLRDDPREKADASKLKITIEDVNQGRSQYAEHLENVRNLHRGLTVSPYDTGLEEVYWQ